MSLKSVVIFFVIIFQLVDENLTYTVNRKFNNSKCQDVCIASGGKAEFDPETKLCKCALRKNIDEADMGVLKKNAKLVYKKLEFLEPNSVLIKREINSHTDLESTGTSDDKIHQSEISTLPPETSTSNKPDPSSEAIVGQANPMGRSQRQRIVTPRRQQSRSISVDQQRLIVQQMRDHLSRLSQTTDQRARQFEIDALRNNLRQLTQSALIQPPQQRSRMRNIVEETRRRRERQRLHPHLVGAVAPSAGNATSAQEGDDTREKEVQVALKEIFHRKPTQKPHFEIITQDPGLIDD